MTNRMRNTYRPVPLRASVRRDLAGGYRDRRRPLYFYARVAEALRSPRFEFAANDERA